ncbi:thiamine-binding protein [Arthrobacter sp. NEB 688]|uniref:thiamine-binding protein n=1 Tax=Arthrobacter sp. NEB 688 TaxID=904039 RepID=UPI001563680B|nr:thiamine-binding protein [Arthrobacter sp. NEB 688]QKE85040.1 thiamine-binding protein [Arthrobacter sp. NEB 688]
MIVAFSIAPASPDETGSYAEAVAEAVGIVRASGLPHETNAMFTNLEGEWDEVFGVLKRCTEAMTARHPRVSLVVKADVRPGHTGMLTSKVQRIDEVLGEG